MTLLLIVSAIVVWLRFRLAERLVALRDAIIIDTLRAHGTRNLFNGQRFTDRAPPSRLNRAQRRAAQRMRRRRC